MGVGLGWVGLWLAPEAGSHGQHGLPSPARLGPTPAVWSHSPQTADDPRTPPRRWWEGDDAAVPVCPRALGSWGGAFKAGAHMCHSPAGRGWRVWGVVCARCSGPQQRGMRALPRGC